MRVRMLVDVSGTRNGEPWPGIGNPIDLPDDEAIAMIAAEQAVPDTSFRSSEKAVVSNGSVETRVAVERPLTTQTGPVPARKGVK